MVHIYNYHKWNRLPIADRGEKEMVLQKLHVLYFNVVLQLMKFYARVIVYKDVFLLCHSKILIVVQPLYGLESKSVVRGRA